MTRLEQVRDFVEVCIEQTGEPTSVADVMSAFGCSYRAAQECRRRALSPDYDDLRRASNRRAVRKHYHANREAVARKRRAPDVRDARNQRTRQRYATDPAFRETLKQRALERYHANKAARAQSEAAP